MLNHLVVQRVYKPVENIETMEAKAFISHTERGGSYVARMIKDVLIQPPREMESFLSEEAIEYGEHIPGAILKALIETDILFVVLEPLVIENRWVKWEDEFCKNRAVRTIDVTYAKFAASLNLIKWKDTDERHLKYNENDDVFRIDIWNAIGSIEALLEQQAHEKNVIRIDAQTDNTDYCEQGIVRVSGNVQGPAVGVAYIHMPCMEQGHPPIHSTDAYKPIILGDDGNFEFEFKLPESHGNAGHPQKWFIELKFDRKSKLIPISVFSKKCKSDIGKLPCRHKHSKTDAAKQEVINQRIRARSKGTIEGIPQTISGQVIPRDDKISELTALMKQNDRIVVTGEKGSGKSVLLCQLYEKISEQQTTLFISCDSYLGIESLEQLNQDIIPDHDFIDYVRRAPTNTNKIVIIFDSLDAISRNEKTMNIFKRFLQNIWGTGKVKTISSVRSYDYEYAPSIGNTDWGVRCRLGQLTRNESNTILAGMGNPAISCELEKILLNPLHLKLVSLIRERSPDADFTRMKSEIELYDEHWNEYVERQEHAGDVRNMLYGIAQEMSSIQRTTIPRNNFGDPNTMHEILSRSIVLSDRRHEQIRFFHHAYLDYVASRFILAKHPEFVNFLLEDEYNVFLRPTIVFALAVLHQRNPDLAIHAIEKMLNSRLKHFWKTSALTALAKIDKSNTRDFSMLGRILTEKTMLQRHFLMEVEKQKSLFWFDWWKNSFFMDWSSSPTNPNSQFIVDYLKSVVERTNDHQSVFKIIGSIVKNSQIGWSKRQAIELSSEIDVKGKADWLRELSTDGDAHIRNGVLKAFPKLIETNPETVPDIFCNLFTYVETSTDATQVLTHGMFGITSTKSQDNRMIIWEAERLFPELLKTNPEQMIASAIKVLETLRKKEMVEYQGNLIEDHGYVWFKSVGHLHDEGKMLNHVTRYLQECTDEKLRELAPLLASTRLATFHSILIDEMVRRKEEFTSEIFDAILDPQAYEIKTLRQSIISAINKAGPLLSNTQIGKLLDNVMSINTNRELGPHKTQYLNRIKAQFLSGFPTDVLQPMHRKILDAFSVQDLEYHPPIQGVKIQVGAENVTSTQPSLEDIITNNLGRELSYEKKIELLDAISKYLDKKTAELEDTKIQRIQEFLIANKNDLDPTADAANQDQHSMLVHDTVRGLVAKCLIKLLSHFKDSALVPSVQELSEDPINTVRSEVCSVLGHLFSYDYDLAHQIAKKYSMDKNFTVQFYLPAALNPIVNQHPEHAALIISNMLKNEQTFGIADCLIYLVFYKKEPYATKLLNEIVDKRVFSSKIRSEIPFALKERWLFVDEYQNQSLELLYRLLDDPCHEVRDKAAFFTLNSLKKDEFEKCERFVRKIGRHLKRIAQEANRREWNPRLIEELLKFLSDFWHLLPEDTIKYLEIATNEKKIDYSRYQAVFAEESIKILASLFQHTSLSNENRERCLDILDTYAVAGWPDALKLLSAMERPD